MAMLPSMNEKYFGQAFLDDILDWISANLEPGEVFLKERLAEWIRFAMNPEEVYGDEALAEWADDNGYVKEE